MPFYADTPKTKPVHQSFGLAGYFYPQQDHQKKLNRIAGKNVLGRNLKEAPGKTPQANPGTQPAPEQPTGEGEAEPPSPQQLTPSARLRDMGLVAYPDPSRPDDSPFRQAEERYDAAIDATGPMARAGALAQTFSAIADAATMLSKGRGGPVAVGHDRTGARLSQDAADRMMEEERQFQGGLQDHFNQLFRHQQQKEQVKQANVQLLNKALISDSQQTIKELRESLENQDYEVPENIRQAEHLIDLARSAAGTDRGNKLATHYMEQAQRLGVFDEGLNLNPEFFDVPMGQPGGRAPGFSETGEVDQDSPQAFDLMQAEVSISDFQRFNDELQEVERRIGEEMGKEVPDQGALDRLQEEKSNLESRITSLKDNEYVQRWDTRNRYRQLQNEREGDLREQQFEFMHGQRGDIQGEALLERGYQDADRSIESGDLSRVHEYIRNVRRTRFQTGGLTFEQAGPYLSNIDSLLEKAGYGEKERRGALDQIMREDLGIDPGHSEGPGAEQDQTQGQGQALPDFDIGNDRQVQQAISKIPENYQASARSIYQLANRIKQGKNARVNRNELLRSRGAISRLPDSEGKARLSQFFERIHSQL